MVTTLAEVAGVLLTSSVVRTMAGNTAGAVTLLLLVIYPVLVCHNHIRLSETGSFFLLSLLVRLLVQFRAHWSKVKKQPVGAVYGFAIIALGPGLLAYFLDTSLQVPFQAAIQPSILLLSLLSSWWFFASLKQVNPIGLVMTGIPLAFLFFQVLSRGDAFAAYPLLLANCVTLLSLAYRGWINKRIPGTW